MRVLASAAGEAEAYPALLAAIGESLGCAGRAVAAVRARTASCAAPRPGRRAPRAGAVAGGRRVRRRRRSRPRRRVRVPARRRRRDGASPPPRRWSPTTALLATMESLGTQISQFVERCRAQQAVRASRRAQERDPQRRLRLHHHDGPPRRRRRGQPRDGAHVRLPRGGDDRPRAGGADRPAGAARRRTARGVAALPARPAHSRSATTRSSCAGMRADGSEFPVELVDHPRRPARPAAVLRLPARRHRGARRASATLRRLADEQAALRRVATAVAASTDPRRVFGVVTEEVARLLGAQSSNMVRFDGDGTATVVGGWSDGDVRNVPVGDTVRMDGDTASARVCRTGAPARVDSYDATRRRARRAPARARLPLAPSPRRSSSAGGCGAR